MGMRRSRRRGGAPAARQTPWWRRVGARTRRAAAGRETYENPYRHGICAAEWTKKR